MSTIQPSEITYQWLQRKAIEQQMAESTVEYGQAYLQEHLGEVNYQRINYHQASC